ncbi:MAG: CehA/McbA family metallohydrolase [Actinomyces sp.]|nr:CehA/McbA family metallohydrolase [Actinomyces sp.]MCI1788154.1 CehA/McbA family metallohydrolase [Actinomyces sp.]MCI1830301.1 CehA/McbA family metallohydrolase [Actinomyces sp.]
MATTRMRRHVTLTDQARERYPGLPFDVDGAVESVEVSLRVTTTGARAVVDLGCEGPHGLRGWSGGARTGFVITRADATPGYLPGLETGRWRVLLGLHVLPEDGADIEVVVRSPATRLPDHGPAEDPVSRGIRGSDRGLPAPAGLTWYAGDPHNHSLHSDGELSLWELANEGIRSGLDYLGCTDHNTVSHHVHLAAVGARQGITLVPGQEITTHRGHANAWGDIGVIDFRRPAQTWVDEVDARGGVMSVNHPVSGDCSWTQPLERAPRGAELFHGSWYRNLTDTSIWAWFLNWTRDVAVLGGGDFHNRSTPLRPGMPTTWVAAEACEPDALIEAIRAGRTTITGSARMVGEGEARPVLMDVPTLVRQGEDLLALDAAGTILVDLGGRRLVIGERRQLVRAPRESGPFCLVRADRSVVALCA